MLTSTDIHTLKDLICDELDRLFESGDSYDAEELRWINRKLDQMLRELPGHLRR